MTGIINALVALWRAGGMSFAFDGATFTPGEYDPESTERTCDVELTLDGASITSGTVGAFIFMTDNATLSGATNASVFNDLSGGYTFGSGTEAWLVCKTADGGKVEFAVGLYSDIGAMDVYINVLLPDGSIVSSEAITVGVLAE